MLDKESLIHFVGKRLGSPIFKYRTRKELRSYSKNIQNYLIWYSNNRQKLEDGMISGKHMGQLLEFIENTDKLTLGDTTPSILELGVFRGGTTICFAQFLQNIKSKRMIYACDTFSGFPYADIRDEQYDETNDELKKTDYDYVIKKYEEFGVANHITALKGSFEDTLCQKLDKMKFSFVLSDSDLYKSTQFSLEFLESRMCKGGIIAFHNYGDCKLGVWGETDAVDEFCHKNKMKLNTEKSIPYLKF